MLKLISGKNLENIYYSPLGPFLTKLFSQLMKNAALQQFTIFDDIKIEINLSKDGERAIPFNAFEPKVTKKVFEIITKNDTVFDIGSWIGYYALIAAKIVGTKGRVISIEPENENIIRIKRNIEINNFSNIITIDSAVGDKTGFGSIVHHSSSTMHKITYDKDSSTRVEKFDDIVDRLSINHIGLVIMDIEGFELNALKGATNSLSKKIIQNLIIEIHPKFLKSLGTSETDIFQFFKSYGYKVDIINRTKTGNPYHVHAKLQTHNS